MIKHEVEEVQFIACFFTGYLIYRVYSYFHPKLPVAFQTFPLYNLTSSAMVILVITCLMEADAFKQLLTKENVFHPDYKEYLEKM